MKQKFLSLLLFFTILSVETFAQKERRTDAQWTNLFDGKTLKGFKQLGGKALYEAKNGEIVGTTVKDTPNSFLTTEQEYGDFILELDLKLDDVMNGGIQFRSLSLPDYQNGRVHVFQM